MKISNEKHGPDIDSKSPNEKINCIKLHETLRAELVNQNETTSRSTKPIDLQLPSSSRDNNGFQWKWFMPWCRNSQKQTIKPNSFRVCHPHPYSMFKHQQTNTRLDQSCHFNRETGGESDLFCSSSIGEYLPKFTKHDVKKMISGHYIPDFARKKDNFGENFPCKPCSTAEQKEPFSFAPMVSEVDQLVPHLSNSAASISVSTNFLFLFN